MFGGSRNSIQSEAPLQSYFELISKLNKGKVLGGTGLNFRIQKLYFGEIKHCIVISFFNLIFQFQTFPEFLPEVRGIESGPDLILVTSRGAEE